MDESSVEFRRLTLEIRRQMRDHRVVGSVLGYALGWNRPAFDPASGPHLLRWLQLWERLGRPYCDAMPVGEG